jgi:hypothetical protein
MRVTIGLEGSDYGGCERPGLVRRGIGGRQPKCGSAHDDMCGERVLMKARKRARIRHVGNEVKRRRFDKSCDDILESTRLYCQPGTSIHRIHVNCISHVTIRHMLTHLSCVYNRSM